MIRLFPFPLLVAFLLMGGSPVLAQRSRLQPEQLYLGLAVGKAVFPDAVGFGLSSTLMLSNHWGGSINFRTAVYDPETLPADYHSGGIIDFDPKDLVLMLSAHLVREWETDAPFLRFGAEAGIGYVQYQYYRFLPNPNPGWFGSNYQEYKSKEETIGLSLRGKVLCLLTRNFGIEVAAAGNLNASKPVGQLEICLDLGFLRGGIGPGDPHRYLPRKRRGGY